MGKNIEELKSYITQIKKVFLEERTAIMPALRFAQERFGEVSDEVVGIIAESLNIPPIKVLSTARFYHFFTEKKTKKFRIEVCSSLSCSLLGSEHIYDYLFRKLNIRDGNEDFSVKRIGCLGSCGTAPVLLINNILFENLNFEKIDRIIEGLKSGKNIDKILE